MGIYIPNMKIPNYCGECKVKGDGSDAIYTWSCPFTGYEYPWHMSLDGRLPECPFKEVPETHGDLIDRDALLKKTINNPLHAPYIVGKDVRDMPTVIEGSENYEHTD